MRRSAVAVEGHAFRGPGVDILDDVENIMRHPHCKRSRIIFCRASGCC